MDEGKRKVNFDNCSPDLLKTCMTTVHLKSFDTKMDTYQITVGQRGVYE